ncbi:cytochrome c oxidase subunit 4 [Haloglycomyces albus]|uniref:cytochrome c oxidase subunit 4 n=1 Tax=Haloglycomyces albus TaxID=526067 RepID=UPI00046D962F|nr:cytochrome c oxidase subunit 4 [Haloglycomyces albus]
MKTENKIFLSVTVSMFLFAGIYGYWTHTNTNPAYGSADGIEWVGTVALVMSGLLTGMIWLAFLIIANRIDPRPEDREDGEISDVSGNVGFFSPGSYWPLGLALASTLAGLGLVYMVTWVIVAGGIALLFTIGGLLFEYYTGTRRTGVE